MVKGTTKDGFNFEVSENIGNDFRIVMALRKLNSGDVTAKIEGTYDFVEAVLGKDGIDKIVTFATKQQGFADSEYIINTCYEIVGIANRCIGWHWFLDRIGVGGATGCAVDGSAKLPLFACKIWAYTRRRGRKRSGFWQWYVRDDGISRHIDRYSISCLFIR